MQALAVVGLIIEPQREMTQIIPRTFYYPAALISFFFFFLHIIIPRVLSVLIGLLQALKEGTMHYN